MDPHPPPPPDLDKLNLRRITIDSGVALWRVYKLGRGPLFFGKTATQRFDDPAGKYGVLYAGESARAAFIESLGWDTRRRAVGWEEVRTRALLVFRPRRAWTVLDLDGPELRRMGADVRLVAGEDHAISRSWSAALHRHPLRVDGLRYRTRHDNREFALALFDRCRRDIMVLERTRFTDPDHAAFLAELLDHYGMGLL